MVIKANSAEKKKNGGNKMKTIIEKIHSGEVVTEEDLARFSPSTKEMVTNTMSPEWDLFKQACELLKTAEQIETFIQILARLNLDEDCCSEIIWRFCFILHRSDLLEALLSAGYKLPKDGNVVRQAAYAGDLQIADLLLRYGYNSPVVLTMFQISNQLSWKFDRLEYLLNAGSRLDISDEAKKCMRLILDRCDSSAMNNDVELS